jgi:hypothetical protein
LLIVLCGCQTWSLTFRDEYRLGVFRNRVLRKIFEPKSEGVRGEWRDYTNRSCMFCTAHQTLFGG